MALFEDYDLERFIKILSGHGVDLKWLVISISLAGPLYTVI